MERNIDKVYDSQISMVNSLICDEEGDQSIETIRDAEKKGKERLRKEFTAAPINQLGKDKFGVSEILTGTQINAIEASDTKFQAITWEDINEAL